MSVHVDEIPVAHTPTGGWVDTMPPAVLTGCDTPLVEGAPDLRGLWRPIEVLVGGTPAPNHPVLDMPQRIEQAGDRAVITTGGVLHDMRCDGTVENGVHDVAAADKVTPITVVATYEDGVHILRPEGLPVEIRRWRDGEHLMWEYVGFVARFERTS